MTFSEEYLKLQLQEAKHERDAVLLKLARVTRELAEVTSQRDAKEIALQLWLTRAQ